MFYIKEQSQEGWLRANHINELELKHSSKWALVVVAFTRKKRDFSLKPDSFLHKPRWNRGLQISYLEKLFKRIRTLINQPLIENIVCLNPCMCGEPTIFSLLLYWNLLLFLILMCLRITNCFKARFLDVSFRYSK